jgi:hypothetical protein
MASVRKRNGNRMKSRLMKWKWTQMKNTSRERGRRINLMSFLWYVALRINTNKARKSTFAMEDYRIDYY